LNISKLLRLRVELSLVEQLEVLLNVKEHLKSYRGRRLKLRYAKGEPFFIWITILI